MKKRVLFHTHMLEADALKKYLDDQLKDGWVLIQVGREILTFEKCEYPNIQYALGIFQCNTTENDEYKNFAEQFGFEYVGDRDGIVIFKTTSDVPFFSDELVDQEFKDTKIRKTMFWQIINMILIMISIFYTYRLTVSHTDFIEDIGIYMCIAFLVWNVSSLFGNHLGVIPYLKYRRNKETRSDYRGIECRSWCYTIFTYEIAVQFFMFMLSAMKHENISYMPYLLGSWIGIAVIGAFVYLFRSRWLRAIEIGLISISMFVVSFMFLIGNQHKPLITTVERLDGLKITTYIDSNEIPFSLCENEICELVQNDIQESIVLKKQVVEEVMNKKSYKYEYFEIKSDLFEETMMKKIMDKNVLLHRGTQRTFKEYFYKYQVIDDEATEMNLFVRKDKEIYLFISIDVLDENSIQTFIQNLPWKS